MAIGVCTCFGGYSGLRYLLLSFLLHGFQQRDHQKVACFTHCEKPTQKEKLPQKNTKSEKDFWKASS